MITLPNLYHVFLQAPASMTAPLTHDSQSPDLPDSVSVVSCITGDEDPRYLRTAIFARKPRHGLATKPIMLPSMPDTVDEAAEDGQRSDANCRNHKMTMILHQTVKTSVLHAALLLNNGLNAAWYMQANT